MFRRILATVVAIAFSLSFVSSFSVARAADVGATNPNMASSQVAAQVTDTLTLFVKRANSSKDASKHRAWEMMTTNGQQVMFFPGEEQYFSPVKTKILQVGDVTLNQSGGFDVEVVLSGLWTAHGLYHGVLSFTGDYLIDNFAALDPIVPEGMTGTTLTVSVDDTTLNMDQVELTQTDVILLSISNNGTDLRLIELDRLADGQTIDDLAQQMTSYSQDQYAFTGVMPGNTGTIGITGVKPGTYVLSSVVTGTASTPQTIIASVVITVK